MAQFDVHRLDGGLVVDCQSNLLDQLASRFVAPLLARAQAPPPASRLNPMFEIEGEQYILMTQSAAAVAAKSLGPVVVSLADRSIDITSALDVLISGV